MDTKDKTWFLLQEVCILIEEKIHVLMRKVDNNAIGEETRKIILNPGACESYWTLNILPDDSFFGLFCFCLVFVFQSHLNLIFEILNNLKESKIGIFMRT